MAKVGERTKSWLDGRMLDPLLDNTLKLGTIIQFTLNKQIKRRLKHYQEEDATFISIMSYMLPKERKLKTRQPMCLELSMGGQLSGV